MGVRPGFEAVRTAFEQNFARRGEIGASVVVYRDGERVVDLHGGTADRRGERAWDRSTLQILFSATKGLVAACFLHLWDQHRYDLDQPVAALWPGFGVRGKERVTIRQVLNHTSGLVAIDRPVSLEDLEGWSSGRDPEPVRRALEAQRPLWEPGTSQGYQAVSFGLYAGEIFRRLAGHSLSEHLASIAGPLGAEVWLGLPEHLEDRVAELFPPARHRSLGAIFSLGVEGRITRRFLRPGTPVRRAVANPAALGPGSVSTYGTRVVRSLALPWASAVGTAEGLARIYAALASGRLVSTEALDRVRHPQSWGWDRVLCKPIGFALGFVKEEPTLYSPNPASFGHPGAGGALGFADPDEGLGFAYTMNRMDHRLRSPRALALARTTYAALEDRC